MTSETGNSARRAFTLIELLLVAAIIAISVGLALPRFAQSFQGAKLRTAGRALVMTHRLARARAVLEQRHFALLFDLVQGDLSLVAIVPAGGGAAEDRFFPEEAETGIRQGAGAMVIEPRETRRLPDGIRMTDFESDGADQAVDDLYWINYYPNGMCDEYAVNIEDERGRRRTLRVDPISGRVEVEDE
jgi:prepilin-type N-terminal cleavage/methylation domain-containing protein